MRRPVRTSSRTWRLPRIARNPALLAPGLLALVLLLALLATATARAQDAPGQPDDADGPVSAEHAAEPHPPIVLGMSAAFSGPSRGLGIEFYRGIMAYLNQVNAQGGVNGRRVEIQPLDDGYNPAPCVSNTVELMEEKDIFALFSYVGTPTTTRVLPLLKRYQDTTNVALELLR